MARRIAESSAGFARAITTEEDARALMAAVASSVPGACETYARLGAGAGAGEGAPEGTADHSPCVQKDLERRTGPRERGRYGFGVWRGAEGALALWKDAAGALRDGLGKADAGVRGGVEGKLEAIEAALGKVETKKLPPAPDYSMFMSDVHADAGVPLGPPLGKAPLPARAAPAPR